MNDPKLITAPLLAGMVAMMIAGCTAAGMKSADAGWHPAAGHVVFTRLNEDPVDLGGLNRALGAGDIMIAQGDGQNIRAVLDLPDKRFPGSSLMDPVLSPDGQQIAFADMSEHGGLWIVDIDGSNLKEIFTGNVEGPAWSPDGKQLAYSAASGNDAQSRQALVYVIDADGTNRRRVGNGLYPDWSPDGRHLLVTKLSDDDAMWNTTLERLPVDGGQPERLVDAPAMAGVWSPDGNRIAYMRVQSQGDPPRLEIVIANADGGSARTVISSNENGSFYYRPRWLSDGQHLLVNAVPFGDGMTPSLLIVDIESGKAQPLIEQEEATNTSLMGILTLLHFY